MNEHSRVLSFHTRLNQTEYDTIQAALTKGQPLTSEWLRHFLLERAERTAFEEVLMAEVLALRTIVLSTLANMSPGAKATVQEAADRDKLDKARQRLAGAA